MANCEKVHLGETKGARLVRAGPSWCQLSFAFFTWPYSFPRKEVDGSLHFSQVYASWSDRGCSRKASLCVLIPNTQQGQTNWNVGIWSKEISISGSCKGRWLRSWKALSPLKVLQSTFITQLTQVSDRLKAIIGWWWGRSVVSQELTSVLRLHQAWGFVLMVIK